ncbi:phage/plasmid-like protein (TIGR03299 family) [Dyadobacter jejuensis]|uniref:Phage/plasmid-like protein (TIGR03299 family) n=2 Tax=Dyadobacter jejuensis TaxID=1082580 RepID=A0A316A6B0_9BACT|nr:phage/plasmid-like protein (TIGR03299 family) [Dyadobacter jejuensis]
MAHLIDNSKGFNAFVSLAQPAWHGLGTVFNEPISVGDALKYGGLDFEVEKLPNIHRLGEVDIISPDSFFTYRKDVNKVLGSKLGKDYVVYQNAQCFDLVDEILQSGKASIETAGSIDGGKKVFVTLKIDQSIKIGGNDIVEQYVLFATSHDGSMAITATPTNVRVVCNNTLTAALSGATGAIRVRHSMNASNRMQEAAKVLKLIVGNTEANTLNYERMRANKIEASQMWDYFGNVFCTPAEIKEMQSGKAGKDVLSTRKQNIINEVLNFANNGVGQDVANEGGLNMWGAYNAVTGYITRKKYSSVDDRANSMLFGAMGRTLYDAGRIALMPDKIQPLRAAKPQIITNFSLN